MSPAFLGNCITGRRQCTIKIKVDILLSLAFLFGKQSEHCDVCMNNDHEKYIKSFSNDTNDTHVLIKIYWEFYHSIVNKANERCHIRIYGYTDIWTLRRTIMISLNCIFLFHTIPGFSCAL